MQLLGAPLSKCMANKTDIDVVPVSKSILDLSNYSSGSFDGALNGFLLSSVADDILLAYHVDETETGEIKRGSIFIKPNNDSKAWRIAKIVLAGPNCKYVKEGDFVMYPSDRGIKVSSIDVENVGEIKNAIFLNEARIFGKCAQIPQKEESVLELPSKPKKVKK